MKTRHYDHIDLRVKDMEVAKRFYGQVLPALGFTREKSDAQWGTFYAETEGVETDFFGFTEDRNHRPNETRIAFWAESREEVDRVAEVVRLTGGQNLEGPELCAEYSPGYYGFFFEDPSGNKLEICCRQSAIVAG
jgi:predicted enzyme related to lactoylglutathione lyase